jgi:hypothetical protein
MEYSFPNEKMEGRISCPTCRSKRGVKQELQATAFPAVLQVKLQDNHAKNFREVAQVIRCLGRKWQLLSTLQLPSDGITATDVGSCVFIDDTVYCTGDGKMRESKAEETLTMDDTTSQYVDRAFYIVIDG